MDNQNLVDMVEATLTYKLVIKTVKGQEIFKLYEKRGFSLKHVKTFEGCDRGHDLKKFIYFN